MADTADVGFAGHVFSDPASLRRILVTHDGNIGDVIMASGAVRMLRDAFPDAYICLEIRAYASKELLFGAGVLDDIVPGVPTTRGFVRSLGKSIRTLRQRLKHYDVCFLLDCDTGMARRMARYAEIPIRICASHTIMGTPNEITRYCTHVVDVPPEKVLHNVEYYHELIRGAGIGVPCVSPWLAIDAEQPGSDSGTRAVALCFDVSGTNRHIWPKEHRRELCRLLLEDGYSLFTCVHPSNSAEAEELSAALSGALRVEYTETLTQCVMELRKAALLVSVDTGQVHIAAAAGVPVLSLAGQTPYTTFPYTRTGLALTTSPGCFHCGAMYERCPSNKRNRKAFIPGYSPPCMSALLPDVVHEYCRRMIANPEQGGGYVLLEEERALPVSP